MEHPSRDMSHPSTIHPRWHIQTSPLYHVMYAHLVSVMKVDGLGSYCLPRFLSATRAPTAEGKQDTDKDNTEDTTVEVTRTKVSVPTSKDRRYNSANQVLSSIAEMMKNSPGVYEMAMPMIQKVRENCALYEDLGSKSMKATAAKNIVRDSSLAKTIPILPECTHRRDKSDDMNKANKKPRKTCTFKKATDGSDGLNSNNYSKERAQFPAKMDTTTVHEDGNNTRDMSCTNLFQNSTTADAKAADGDGINYGDHDDNDDSDDSDLPLSALGMRAIGPSQCDVQEQKNKRRKTGT